MRERAWLGCPVLRQLTGGDKLARGAAVRSRRTERIEPRIRNVDRVVKSVCPYCAVGCAQHVYVKDEKVIQIEGDPDAPHSRGRLCPKGSATLQLTTGSSREQHVLYRKPDGTGWERLGRATTPPVHEHRRAWRRDPRQRGELSDQEAVHRARRDPDREPGTGVPQ